MEFQKEWNEFMTLNVMEGIKGFNGILKMEGIKGIHQWSINGIQWNRIRSGKNQ